MERQARIRDAVTGSGFDAVAAFGSDNFTYLTGAVLPFPDNYPDRKTAAIVRRDGEATAVVPSDWAEAVKDQGFKGAIRPYSENDGAPPRAFAAAFAGAARELGAESLGYDARRATVSLLEAVAAEAKGVKLAAADGLLSGLRAVKTAEEVGFIEAASLQADRGIVHALNHLEGTVTYPGYYIPEYAERVRVHIFESGGSGVGHLSATFGGDTRLEYTPNRGAFRQGELFRTDVSSHFRGYWTSVGRMAFTGTPGKEVEDAYRVNRRLKAVAEAELKAGASAAEIHDKVHKFADWIDAPFDTERVLAHGVGASHFEPPFIHAGSPDRLQAGNVIALDVVTLGAGKEILRDKDVYLVEESGARKLSWYRNWERPYPVTGFRAFH